MLNQFFWWSGLLTWIAFGSIGLLFLSDAMLDTIMSSVKLKHEFLQWAWERTRARAKAREKTKSVSSLGNGN